MKNFIIRSKEYRDHYCHFMKHLQAVGYSQSSYKTFATSIREFLWWLEKQKITGLDQITETDIENFHAYQQERPGITTSETLSEKRIYINMYVLKLFFRYLQDTDQLESNPVNDFDYPTPERHTRENLLSLEDIKTLYQVCETSKQKAVLGIIYGCGLRRQEAIKLNTRDIHFKSALLYVREGKGGRKRTVPLSKKVLADLKEYYYNQRPHELNRDNIDSIEAFMLNAYGTRMREQAYWITIKRLIAAAGLNQKISLHHFRHAIATHLLESGMKLEHVKDFLGHKSLETTQTYTHITITQMKKTTNYGTEKIPD